MKRFIAILTLALTAALSADEAFAQQGNSVPNATLSVIQTGESGMDGIAGMLHVQIEDSGGSTDLYSPDTVDGIIAIIALAATEVGITDLYLPDNLETASNSCGVQGCPIKYKHHHDSDSADCPRIMDAGLTGPIGGTLDRTPTVIDPDDCPNLIDPDDCPNLVDPNDCPEIMDLWCELLDAGYTEDEAFEMIEMVMGEDIAEPLPERLPVKSYEDMVTY